MALPGITDLKSTMQTSKAEQHLLGYLKEIREESDTHKKRYAPETDDEDALNLYRGNYRPHGRDNYFSCDFIQTFIDRMVAQLTDNRPIIRIEHKKSGLKDTATALEKVIQAVWLESQMQRQAFKMCHNAAVRRSAGLYIGYDAACDDIYLEMLTKDQVWFDPQVKEAALLNKGEYTIIKRVKPLDEIKSRFPGRGVAVKPDDISYTGSKSGSLIKGPITDMLKLGRQKGPSSIIPRACLYEAILQDRQVSANGKKLFPFGRRVIYTDDLVLWDGPIPYWDGDSPVDWFDWAVDPEHFWGISAPQQLKRLQLGFNEILDGTVTNVALSNFLQIIMSNEAVDPAQWRNLQRITNSLIVRKTSPNQQFEITPPPAFGMDKLLIAKSLFTYAQLLTGVTDVTLGEHPGSLQSGQAISGLQEGAALMTCARASRLEDFYGRVGAKLLARVLQFWTSDRVFHLLGPTGAALDYASNRAELFIDKDTNLPVPPEVRQEALRHLRFAILPGSSAPGSRNRRAEMMVKLNMLGAASRKAVLQAADFPDPDQMLQEAEADFHKFPPPGFQRVKGQGSP